MLLGSIWESATSLHLDYISYKNFDGRWNTLMNLQQEHLTSMKIKFLGHLLSETQED